MSTLAGTHTRKARGLTGCVGGCVAAIGFSQTGMVAALPAAAGLTAVAASDLTTHHFSLRTLRVTAAVVVVGLVLDALRGSAWDRLADTVLLASVVALGTLVLWVMTASISFGDVLLLTFAVLVPAWLSPRAVVVTILAAAVIGGAIATVQRVGRLDGRSQATIALGPALLAGWAVGVVVG